MILDMKYKNKIYIIAEIGVNHNGNINTAKEMIIKCKKSGADAVKFQTYKTENICDTTANKASYQKKSSNEKTQYEMLKKYELTFKQFSILKNYANNHNIDFLTTASDVETFKFITKNLRLSTIKIGSSDLTNIQLLLHAGNSKKKVILSTGMSSLKEIDIALSALCYGLLNKDHLFDYKRDRYLYLHNKNYIKSKITLLHCTTEYPAPIDELNLNVIATLQERYNTRIGYSDHSHNVVTSLVAIGKGASVIEVHVTKCRSMVGPDHSSSLTFTEFKKYNQRIREAETILGSYTKTATKSENNNKPSVMKKLFFTTNIKKGVLIKDKHISCKRSESGLSSIRYSDVINKIVTKDFKKSEKINMRNIKKHD